MTDKENTQTLLPCPFCGGEAEIYEFAGEKLVLKHPQCTKCEACTETVEEWNTRPQPDLLAEAVEVIKQAVEVYDLLSKNEIYIDPNLPDHISRPLIAKTFLQKIEKGEEDV